MIYNWAAITQHFYNQVLYIVSLIHPLTLMEATIGTNLRFSLSLKDAFISGEKEMGIDFQPCTEWQYHLCRQQSQEQQESKSIRENDLQHPSSSVPELTQNKPGI